MRKNRGATELRTLKIEPDYLSYAEGSALIELGNTRVLCAASVENGVPSFLEGKGSGWLSAEYSMLPRATSTRSRREVSRGRPSGRTMEIQRLIGRALRAVVDLKKLGPRTVWLDCDVIQADGGTRTSAVSGAVVALALALRKLMDQGALDVFPLRTLVAAVSVGRVAGKDLLDLQYTEDSTADLDLNVVKTAEGRYVEIQGTAEGETYDDHQLHDLLKLAGAGIREIQIQQSLVLKGVLPDELLVS